MPSYKLIYLDGRGRAEVCRLLFTLAGQDFEDERLAGEKWTAFKPKTLLGQVPVMEIDGKQFTQSLALANYLAREFGFYGKTNMEGLQIDEISGVVADFLIDTGKAVFAEESKKEAAMKEFKEIQVPKYLKALDKKLKESGTGYFVGSSVTLADLEVYDLCFSMNVHFPGFVDDFPKLKEHKEKIENMDRIKQYVAQRKHTQF